LLQGRGIVAGRSEITQWQVEGRCPVCKSEARVRHWFGRGELRGRWTPLGQQSCLCPPGPPAPPISLPSAPFCASARLQGPERVVCRVRHGEISTSQQLAGHPAGFCLNPGQLPHYPLGQPHPPEHNGERTEAGGLAPRNPGAAPIHLHACTLSSSRTRQPCPSTLAPVHSLACVTTFF
jgi:hypothetical protein